MCLLLAVTLSTAVQGEETADFSTLRAEDAGIALRSLSKLDTGDPRLQEAIGQVWPRFLGNAAYYGQSENNIDYIRLAQWATPHLDKEYRDAVRDTLANTMMSTRGAWTALKPADLYRLRVVFEELDLSRAVWAEGVKIWFVDGDAWRTNDPEQAASAFNRLKEAAKYTDMKEAERLWVENVQAQLTSSPEWLDATKPNDFAQILHTAFPESVTDEFRQSVTDALYARFEGPGSELNQLKPWKVEQLRVLCTRLQIEENPWAEWARRWSQETDTWQSADVDDIVSGLYRLRTAQESVDMDEAYERVAFNLSSRSLFDPQWMVATSSEDLCKLLREMDGRLDASQQRYLASAMIPRLVEGPDFNGELWFPKYIAKLFNTPELRGALRQELMDAEGVPRRNVGVVLGWSYYGGEEVHVWRDYLDEQINSGRASRDVLASWQLIRAEASLSLLIPADRSEVSTEQWAAAAIDSARDEHTKLAALEWYVRHQVRRGDAGEAALAVSAQMDQFSDEGIRTKLSGLKQRLEGHGQAVITFE